MICDADLISSIARSAHALGCTRSCLCSACSCTTSACNTCQASLCTAPARHPQSRADSDCKHRSNLEKAALQYVKDPEKAQEEGLKLPKEFVLQAEADAAAQERSRKRGRQRNKSKEAGKKRGRPAQDNAAKADKQQTKRAAGPKRKQPDTADTAGDKTISEPEQWSHLDDSNDESSADSESTNSSCSSDSEDVEKEDFRTHLRAVENAQVGGEIAEGADHAQVCVAVHSSCCLCHPKNGLRATCCCCFNSALQAWSMVHQTLPLTRGLCKQP